MDEDDTLLMEQPRNDTQPTIDVLLARVRAELASALVTLEVLVSRGHPGSLEWSRKLDRLRREISGEGGRRVSYGAAVARQEPIGPVISLAEWCESMVQKISQFREEYEASMAESPEHFPAEKTAADWSHELAVFVPVAREAEE